jgi:hypothetical protein
VPRDFAFRTLIPFGRTFKPITVNNYASGWVRQVVWADAVYVPDFMKFAGLAPDALLKLTAILRESHLSIDMAALALEAYDKLTGGRLQQNYLRRLAAA